MPAPREVVAVRKFVFSSLLFSVLCCLLTPVSAQTSVNDVHIVPRQTTPSLATNSIPVLKNPGLQVIKTDVKLVLVPVSVTDPMQRFVTGLSQDNFEVFEDKKPQTIRNFSSEDVPISVGIVLDNSGSMADKVDRVRDAVNAFCDSANPEDEFFMISFGDVPHLAVDFTSSTDDVEKELLFLRPKGRTSLLDAIYMALAKMKHARYGKKALLIVSDGGDNHSRYGEREVKSLAKESDVMIYSIGTFDRYVPTLEEARGPALLSELAEPTGGQSFTLDNPNDMPTVARHIGLELRTQYVLAYRPQSSAHDGKFRRIRVKLKLPRHFIFLQAHARSGYFPSAE